MSIEDLRKKYAGAYDSDFEMPEDSAPETTDEEDSSTDESTEEEGNPMSLSQTAWKKLKWLASCSNYTKSVNTFIY